MSGGGARNVTELQRTVGCGEDIVGWSVEARVDVVMEGAVSRLKMMVAMLLPA